jgi:hypothetical protein
VHYSGDSIAVIFLLGPEQHYQRASAAYQAMILGVDFSQLRNVGFIFPGEFDYWLAVRRGLLKYDASLDGETRDEAYRMLRQDVYSHESHGAESLR